MTQPLKRLKLQGFNNLTKSLSFNIYDVCYTDSCEQREAYIAYIDEAYNAERLTTILTKVANIIGANVLNVARQDYDPQGASVTMLIAEEHPGEEAMSNSATPGPLPDAVVAHLDKSHIAVHTYPESHPRNGISTFRADIDVSTCGLISPLKALNYLIRALESDIVIMDYRVRGFTRNLTGRKHFIDHNISSIQNYLTPETKYAYQMIDVNVYQENLFHTKMVVNDFRLDDYLFCVNTAELSDKEYERIQRLVRREMMEIFYGRNLNREIERWTAPGRPS
ncbi:adenosylmethionine decarboxylase [Rhodoferax sp. 4810]|uniref:S-adenosylmethionine decarboxylase proenzyme n=1 Tax=Thiospirillum jenense TaxID=1653858 RepID=A0A839HIU6_9GAMM|nr:adenosylmethionine decarboxylase [Thiospirillum jenense]MBB1073485.1 adenosylmethionine decarboxylase [Rhodoferax jenense]MBB1125972.1 adenosylmethionine decarboxylase [Thiospirillum jenense]